MSIRLAYGKTGLNFTPDPAWKVELVEPKFVPALNDPQVAIRQALRAPIGSQPLVDLVKPGDRVGIVFSDLTRPTPNHLILPVILDELARVTDLEIILFNALGTHRPNSREELSGMLGEDLVDGYRIVQNNAFDPSTQVCLGTSSRGHPIWINQELAGCDFKILTGFIEPHLFAGFSGGGKAILPGMAGQTTILDNHDAGMIAHPRATWGITHGNPIWEEIREAARQVPSKFLVNVSLNRDKAITGIFAGDLEAAYEAGCAFVRETAMVAVDQPYDIVLTTNSGYPLDLNLYQSVKGMSAAAQIVRQGGTILVAAECWDGIPEHGLYKQMLDAAKSPQELLEKIHQPGFLQQDQWQVQIQSQILLKADVYVYSKGITPAQIQAALLKPCLSIEETLAKLIARFGSEARICVLPEGPQTIPYLQPQVVTD
jgi:nickel-dependent lactate racemase